MEANVVVLVSSYRLMNRKGSWCWQTAMLLETIAQEVTKDKPVNLAYSYDLSFGMNYKDSIILSVELFESIYHEFGRLPEPGEILQRGNAPNEDDWKVDH